MNRTTMPYAALRPRSDTFENPRQRSGLDTAAIRELAVDISRRGLLYPLVVSPAGVILGGQRRHLALGLLIAEAMPRAEEYRDAVPVTAMESEDETTALADNLKRVQLSSYEVVARIAKMSDDGMDGQAIADAIGRSSTFVSRALATWRAATPELVAAWCCDVLSYDAVKKIAAQPSAEQVAAVRRATAEKQRREGRPGRPRGSTQRPGMDAVRKLLRRLNRMNLRGSSDEPYWAGVRDALRWYAGEEPSADFAHVRDEVRAGAGTNRYTDRASG
jgi:hypothetical protein